MSKKLLLTGASGFIGSNILEHFLERTDWTIICPCSWERKGEPQRILEVLAKHGKDRVRVITHDLNVPFTDRQVLSLGYVDYFLNCASLSHVTSSIKNPRQFITNNVNIALNVLELARKICPEKFISLGSDESYGSIPDGQFSKEWDAIVPSNPYSGSKACQEAIGCAYWRSFSVPLILTNTVNNFGKRQDTEKWVAKLIRQLHTGEEVMIHTNSGVISKRFYLYVLAHASAMLHILNNVEATRYDGLHNRPARFNITSDTELDNLEIAKVVSEIMAKPFKYTLVSAESQGRPNNDGRYALDGAKLAATGWKSEYPFEDSLRETINFTLANPSWI